MGGYLGGASGRAPLATMFMDDAPISDIPDILIVIEATSASPRRSSM